MRGIKKSILNFLIIIIMGFSMLIFSQTNVDGMPEYNEDLKFAQVQMVVAEKQSEQRWSFSVTLRHNDEGWDHYADLWQVVSIDGETVYGERELLHPHVNEQPFTRSQRGIEIPPEVTKVLVRARCTEHGFEGRKVLVDLSRSEGEGFKVRGQN